MSTKTFCGIFAVMLICAMIWVMVPSRVMWDGLTTTVSHLNSSDIVADDVAIADTAKIQVEAALHSGEGHYDPRMAYEQLKRLVYLKDHVRAQSLASGQIQATLAYLAGVRGQQVGSAGGEGFKREMNRLIQSQEFHDLTNFSPIITEWHFRPIFDHWKSSYPLTMLFALPFFICMLLRRGFNPLVELVMPFQLAGACVFWPVGAFIYPTADPARQVEKAIRGLGYILCFLISICSANLAKAQQKGQGETKWEAACSLQVDGITIPLPVSDLPQPVSVETPHVGNQQKIPDVVVPEKPKVTYQVNVYADGHERQSWLFVNFWRWSIYQQNRESTDGASPFSYLGVGPRFRIKAMAVTAWIGPQYTYRTVKFDKALFYSAFVIKRPRWSFLSANKFAFSTDGKSLFAHRHVQNIHAPPMPSWLSFQGEELHIPSAKKPWQEMEFGTMVSFGGLLHRHSQFLRDCYLYSFRDLARGEWNLRVGYAHTFGQ